MRTRTVYYVWYATAEENQNGAHHRSEPFYEIGAAKAEATLKWESNDYVSIDKVIEAATIYGWEQAEGTETERIEVE